MIRNIDGTWKKSLVDRKTLRTLVPVVVLGIWSALPMALSQSAKVPSTASPAAQQKAFATPQQAAEALVMRLMSASSQRPPSSRRFSPQ